ncbi:hypothetical protein MicloDRAFT_00006620 [Microvirga lotononidis]|uniref:Uncharacterized protein n=1 Tax=Microvirga lotononidis TaxID=864069 RepID=I4Z3G7_9HYPH|nr:hypothetical protein MicloDRAFT_00006620 [Microvirga lotononidis]
MITLTDNAVAAVRTVLSRAAEPASRCSWTQAPNPAMSRGLDPLALSSPIPTTGDRQPFVDARFWRLRR